MLMAPPAVPRPLMTEDGPLRISICSVKKFSRMLTAGSRMPSTNGDAGRGAADLLEAGGVLVAQHLLRQHRDAARRIGDRLAELARLQAVCLVRRGRIGIRVLLRQLFFCLGFRLLLGQSRSRGAFFGGAAQGVAYPYLFRRWLGRRRFRARDRCVYGHRRQRLFLRFRPGHGRNRNQAADSDLLRRIALEHTFKTAQRRKPAQRGRPQHLAHKSPPESSRRPHDHGGVIRTQY
jgi:hypothetical protein